MQKNEKHGPCNIVDLVMGKRRGVQIAHLTTRLKRSQPFNYLLTATRSSDELFTRILYRGSVCFEAGKGFQSRSLSLRTYIYIYICLFQATSLSFSSSLSSSISCSLSLSLLCFRWTRAAMEVHQNFLRFLNLISLLFLSPKNCFLIKT